MIALVLMRALLKAIRPGTRLILVGDADQLPSVGAGNVLGDILDSGEVPCVRLTEIYRQSGESHIVLNAHRINSGDMPLLNEKGTDFFFERRQALSDAADSVTALVTTRLPGYLKYPDKERLYRSIRNIQVLAPAYKGLKSHEIDGTRVNRFRYAPASWEILTHEEGAPSKMASKPWLQLLAIPYIISGFFKCLKICRKWRPDVIHAHWPFPHAYIALGAAKLLRIPLVLNFHGAELLLIRKKKWVKPLLKFAIGQAQAVFANSSFTAGKIKAIRNVDVEWSPYGTTLDEKGGSRPEARGTGDESLVPHSVDGKFTVLFVGRHI
jgi:glycosyltransferase involved in cell wall biosynthesis